MSSLGVTRSAPRILALCLILLASAATAQVEVLDTTSPFRDFDDQNLATIGSAQPAPLQLNLPPAMAVSRPLKLMPPRPTLVLEGPAQADAALAEITARRQSILREMREKRKQQDAAGIMRLARELEDNRLDRLQRLRVVATPVLPATVDPAAPVNGTEPGAPQVPVLPLPKSPNG